MFSEKSSTLGAGIPNYTGRKGEWGIGYPFACEAILAKRMKPVRSLAAGKTAILSWKHSRSFLFFYVKNQRINDL